MSRPEINPDVTKHIVELVDGDQWALADYLAEQFPPDVWGDPSSKENNGLHAVLDRYQHSISREFGVEVKRSTMSAWRATAIAWPHSARAECASFDVHARIRGDDRVAQLDKYIRMAKREGSALSRRMLTRYRADENPKTPRQYEPRLRQAIANAVKREMLGGLTTTRDKWWTIVTEAERAVAVRELRALAEEIAKGGESDA